MREEGTQPLCPSHQAKTPSTKMLLLEEKALWSKEDQMKQIYTQTEPTITENRVQWVELIQATNIQTVTVHFSTQLVCKAIGTPRAHTWGIPGGRSKGRLAGPQPHPLCLL